jgi:ELWxxDGT repeat protein
MTRLSLTPKKKTLPIVALSVTLSVVLFSYQNCAPPKGETGVGSVRKMIPPPQSPSFFFPKPEIAPSTLSSENHTAWVAHGDRYLFFPNSECLLWSTHLSSESTEVIADLTELGMSQLEAAYPVKCTEAALLGSDLLIISGWHPNVGWELWSFDLGSQEISIVKDIAPGTLDSDPGGFFTHNDILYFISSHPLFGRELWRSDGTEDGTHLVKDFFEGESPGHPKILGRAGDLLILLADDGTHGKELWRSDGTSAGTTLYYEMIEGEEDANLVEFEPFRGGLVFWKDGEVWFTDGTTSGTQVITNFKEGGAEGPNRGQLVIIDETLYFLFVRFVAGQHETSLWSNEGTLASHQMVYSSVEEEITVILRVWTDQQRILFFAAKSNLPLSLWEIPSGRNAFNKLFDIPGLTNPSAPRRVGDRFVFAGKTQDTGEEIWVTDSTLDGTHLLLDIFTGSEEGTPNGSRPYWRTFSGADGRVFRANDGVHGFEFWVTDGSAENTELLNDFNENIVGTNPDHLSPFLAKLTSQ